jgi:hypothetical protein
VTFFNDLAVSTPPNLAIVFGLLMVLIGAAPVLATGAGWLAPQLITLVTATMLALLPGAPDADLRRSITIFKPLVAAALIPAAWMLMQIVPVPRDSIAHPIWRSASAALSAPVAGHISIDLGFTLRAFFEYLSLIALAFLTSVLARNRDRAETILFALCTITTFTAVELMLIKMTGETSVAGPQDASDNLVALASFGTILNAAFIVRTVERYETRAQRLPTPQRNYIGMLLAGVTGGLVCLFALLHSAAHGVLMAMTFGLIILFLVVAIRRLSLRRWTAATVSAAAFVACCGVIVLQFSANASVAPLFRFTRIESVDAAAATLHMLSDASWSGTGVGTYHALTAIYRDGTGLPDQAPVNTMASMILEWGYAGVLLIAILLLQLLIVLLRGALSRGRDSFFAATAAACLVTIACEAYCDASFGEITVKMLAAIIVGMGLSQTLGNQAK